MKTYDSLIITRDEEIERIKDWVWIAVDNGAWTGPKKDYELDHKKNILQYCKKFDTVLCAGGNQGMYPRLYSELFKLVYTFEPDPLNFYCLVRNCQKDNIIKIQAALGENHKMIKMGHPCKENTGMHNILDGEDATIPLLKIDDFVFKTLDFIHLDIERSEFSALKGAVITITLHKPMIIVENPNQSIVAFLSNLGYTIQGRSSADTIFSV